MTDWPPDPEWLAEALAGGEITQAQHDALTPKPPPHRQPADTCSWRCAHGQHTLCPGLVVWYRTGAIIPCSCDCHTCSPPTPTPYDG